MNLIPTDQLKRLFIEKVHPNLENEEKKFFNSYLSFGSFWTFNDFLPVTFNPEKFDQVYSTGHSSFVSLSRDSANLPVLTPQNIIVNKEASTTLHGRNFEFCTIGHGCICLKCKRPCTVLSFNSHAESCPGVFLFEKSTDIYAPNSSLMAVSTTDENQSANINLPVTSVVEDSSTKQNSLNNGNTTEVNVTEAGIFQTIFSKNKRKQVIQVDLDKHCGVLNEDGSYCVRALTCKSHSMGMKRSVKGRSTEFDILLARHHSLKAAAAAAKNSISTTIESSGNNTMETFLVSDSSRGSIKSVPKQTEISPLTMGNVAKKAKSIVKSNIQILPSNEILHLVDTNGTLNYQSQTVTSTNAISAGISNTDEIDKFLENENVFSDLKVFSEFIKGFYSKNMLSKNIDRLNHCKLLDPLGIEYCGAFQTLIHHRLESLIPTKIKSTPSLLNAAVINADSSISHSATNSFNSNFSNRMPKNTN